MNKMIEWLFNKKGILLEFSFDSINYKGVRIIMRCGIFYALRVVDIERFNFRDDEFIVILNDMYEELRSEYDE